MSAAWKAGDQQSVYLARFDAMVRARLRPLVTDERIAAHKKSPAGPHDDEMERLLNYFRRAPVAQKYVIHAIRPFHAYRVMALSGVVHVPPEPVDDRVYATEDEAQHAVFLHRVADLMRD